MKRLLLTLAIIVFGVGAYYIGYVNGYADAITWAKGVVWD
jgi:hypothetical protein